MRLSGAGAGNRAVPVPRETASGRRIDRASEGGGSSPFFGLVCEPGDGWRVDLMVAVPLDWSSAQPADQARAEYQ
jgi:hypothetical protein